jgi:hypothetical protein
VSLLWLILNDFENSLGIFFLSHSVLDEIHILISYFNLKIIKKIQTPHYKVQCESNITNPANIKQQKTN